MVDLGDVAVDVLGKSQPRNVEMFICLVRVQMLDNCLLSTPTLTTAFWVAFIPTMNQLSSFLYDVKRRDLAEPYSSRFTTLAMFLYVSKFYVLCSSRYPRIPQAFLRVEAGG